MSVLLRFCQLAVQPGQRLILQDVAWEQFESILAELGERRGSRLVYNSGVLEIRMPLPEHETNKVLLGYLIAALCEELEVDFLSFGSTTFKRRDLQQGFQPDDCFYVTHYRQMLGKTRLDLSRDPPPDFAIEVDLTSKTQLDVYRGMAVPELWRLEEGCLRIDALHDGDYTPVEYSRYFPGWPLTEAIPRFLAMGAVEGPRATLQAFREWVRTRR